MNGQKFQCSPGNCKTYNVIYLVQCSLCSKAYTGLTTQQINKRINEHRSKYYEIIECRTTSIMDDDHSLGVHLVDHGCSEREDFNKIYKVCILDNCSPKLLPYKENEYIHLLKTLRPLGLNTINPYGLKLFY